MSVLKWTPAQTNWLVGWFGTYIAMIVSISKEIRNEPHETNLLKIQRNGEQMLADFHSKSFSHRGLKCSNLDFKIEMWAKYSRIPIAKFLLQLAIKQSTHQSCSFFISGLFTLDFQQAHPYIYRWMVKCSISFEMKWFNKSSKYPNVKCRLHGDFRLRRSHSGKWDNTSFECADRLMSV